MPRKAPHDQTSGMAPSRPTRKRPRGAHSPNSASAFHTCALTSVWGQTPGKDLYPPPPGPPLPSLEKLRIRSSPLSSPSGLFLPKHMHLCQNPSMEDLPCKCKASQKVDSTIGSCFFTKWKRHRQPPAQPGYWCSLFTVSVDKPCNPHATAFSPFLSPQTLERLRHPDSPRKSHSRLKAKESQPQS